MKPLAHAAIAALAVTLPTVAQGLVQIPKVFNGDWCPVAGKNDLYRRGKCRGGIHITTDGLSSSNRRCLAQRTEAGPKDFEVDFACKGKNNLGHGVWGVWIRKTEKGDLNMWTRE